MTINKKGKWWKGTAIADLDEYLREYSAGGYSPDRFVHPSCACGKAGFRIETDDQEGACPCGAEIFELSVAFHHRKDGSVKWVSVGGRCLSCGVLGAYTDWKIDYGPTDHLYGRV